ncbi:hypothetical protein A2U01_0024848, partial [Trifolium medium]|nr:hypothetical protein [Trifolium medium]
MILFVFGFYGGDMRSGWSGSCLVLVLVALYPSSQQIQFAGGCWFVNRFVLAAGSYAVLS